MKKTLLYAGLFACSSAMAQQLDASNEPAIGATANMFTLDSNATNYAAVTGNGVIWDYSNTLGYSGSTRIISVGDATTDPNFSDFPGTTKTIGIQGFLKSFITSNATMRTSHGFIFNEPTAGEIITKYDQNQQTVVSYPFALGSTLTDTYAGSIETAALGTIPATGTSTATIDGQGTLLLGQNVSYTNVIRYKISETTTATIPFIGSVDLIREQYEYYDFATSNLPVFTHVKATLTGAAASESQLVLSNTMPNGYLSLEQIESNNFSIYPNPATESFSIKGEMVNAEVEILDQNGKVVSHVTNVSNGQKIDVATLESGMYIVKIIDGNTFATKQLIVK